MGIIVGLILVYGHAVPGQESRTHIGEREDPEAIGGVDGAGEEVAALLHQWAHAVPHGQLQHTLDVVHAQLHRPAISQDAAERGHLA